ncbi:hypothetical protein BD779DRAFT_1499060 [Infundibulicybe gibba]|nr:hypothetical protein BD779DRAFT_1499060 [Infundibulicybe gibba]
MPLDGHSYLVAQGWSGKGTGLRQGAISRPLAIPQKKTLAGLGKDRDEAFPFWDHLFSAASKAIQLKIQSDDDMTGTLATPSGSATPDEQNEAGFSRLSLLATAKREAARRRLYASFFRGPVLGPDVVEESKCDAICDETVDAVPPQADKQPKKKRREKGVGEDNSVQERRKRKRGQDGKKEKEKKSKRQSRDVEVSGDEEEEQEIGHPPDETDVSAQHKERRKKKRKRERNTSGECDEILVEIGQPPSSKPQINIERVECDPILTKKKKKRRDK